MYLIKFQIFKDYNSDMDKSQENCAGKLVQKRNAPFY